MRFLSFLCVAVLAALVPTLAFAGDAATANGVIDLSGLAITLVHYSWYLLAFAAGWLWLIASKKFGVDKFFTEEQFQKLITPLLDEAVAFGVGKLKDADWLKIKTKNEALEVAVEYAFSHGAELLDKFGIDESTLREKLEAKLTQNGWDIHPGQWQE